MHSIPKHLQHRITIRTTKHDPVGRITEIVPLEPCECGEPLSDTRITRIARVYTPETHLRELCQTCHRVSILGKNDWKTALELNKEMRENLKDK